VSLQISSHHHHDDESMVIESKGFGSQDRSERMRGYLEEDLVGNGGPHGLRLQRSDHHDRLNHGLELGWCSVLCVHGPHRRLLHCSMCSHVNLMQSHSRLYLCATSIVPCVRMIVRISSFNAAANGVSPPLWA